MEPAAALGRAARRRRKASPAGKPDTPGAAPAPVVSVHAPADLGQGCATPATDDTLTSSKTMVVNTYFFLWAVLYTVCFFTTVAALEEVYLPWGLTAVQHLIGCALVIVLWVVKARPVPRLSLADMKVVFPIAACHTLSHVCFAVVLGENYSDDSFFDFVIVEIVFIASRPLFTALFSTIFLKHTVSRWVRSTLLVLFMAGSAVMAMDDGLFHWFTKGGVIGFHFAASAGTALAKRSMGTTDTGDNMSPANLYAVVTIMSSMMSLPLCIIMESSKIEHLYLWWDTKLEGDGWFVLIFLNGFCFFLYNDVSSRCLGLVRPLTHTMGHTFGVAGTAIIIAIQYDDVVGPAITVVLAATTVVWLYVLAGTIEAQLCRQKKDRNA